MEITLKLNAKFQPVQGITGDVEQMKNIKIDFLAGAGYTLENIEKTDYINCSPPLLFTD